MSGSSKYDSRTTTFNPDGRLLQVEYAIEHINQDSSVVGIMTKEGKIRSKLVINIDTEFKPCPQWISMVFSENNQRLEA